MSRDEQEFAHSFFWGMLTIAFNNGALIDAPADDPRIKALVTDYDCVVAAWPDQATPQHFVFLSVSGAESFGMKDNVRLTAIPRPDAASALALQKRYGTPADVESNNFDSAHQSPLQ